MSSILLLFSICFLIKIKQTILTIFVDGFCYFFKCDAILKFAFIFNVLKISKEEFLAIYRWNTIKWKIASWDQKQL